MKLAQLAAYDRAHPARAGTNAEEKFLLYSLVRMIRPAQVIEIGVSGGHSTVWIAQALEDNGTGNLCAVDSWAGRPEGTPWPEYKDAAVERLRAAGVLHRVTLIRMDSTAYLRTRLSGNVEIVWIDGGHTYDQALADIREALRVASRLVIVHDATNIEGVGRACRNIGGGVWVYGSPPNGHRGLWLRNAGPPDVARRS